MADYVDFKTVKAEISVEDVAARYGVALRRVNGSHERGKCPLPTHPAGDDAKSFSINVSKRVWICHSTACAKGRRGKKGGDVIELVSVMESCSLRDAGLKLASWFGIEMNRSSETSATISRPDPKDELPLNQPARMGDSDARYGVYDPLAEWIELRAANQSLSPFEKSAYIAVLGQIEELAKAGTGGAT
jgi:DNA primase